MERGKKCSCKPFDIHNPHNTKCTALNCINISEFKNNSLVNSKFALPKYDNNNNVLVSFPYGVWSGDVSSTTIVLSTRAEVKSGFGATFSDLPVVGIQVKVSSDTSFDPDIAGVFTKQIEIKKDYLDSNKNYRTNPGDYIAKVEVTELVPNTRYFYQFFAFDNFPTNIAGSTNMVGKKVNAKSMMGSFMTLPEPTSNSKISFAVISCKNTLPFDPMHGIANDGKVKFIHFNGNIVYADLNLDPKNIPQTKLLEYYRHLYRDLHSVDYVGKDFIEVYSRIPVVSNWDDHEVINDYVGNGTNCQSAVQTNFEFNQRNVEELKKVGYQAFMEYAAISDKFNDFVSLPACTQPEMNRIFRKMQVNSNVLNIILDERQYRDPPALVPNNANYPAIPVLPPSNPSVTNSPPLSIDQLLAVPVLGPALVQLRDTNPTAFAGLFGPPNFVSTLRNQNLSFLGYDQKEWFKKSLLESKSAFKFVINEVPFGDYTFFPYDSWTGYYKERQEIYDFIQRNKITGVIFVTGNANFGAINRISSIADEVPIWEIITGPIGQRTMDTTIRSIGGNPDFYYAFISAFNASTNQGGIPNLTNNGLKFLIIDTPNWLRITYNENITVTLTLASLASLSPLSDKVGRSCRLTLNSDGIEVTNPPNNP